MVDVVLGPQSLEILESDFFESLARAFSREIVLKRGEFRIRDDVVVADAYEIADRLVYILLRDDKDQRRLLSRRFSHCVVDDTR